MNNIGEYLRDKFEIISDIGKLTIFTVHQLVGTISCKKDENNNPYIKFELNLMIGFRCENLNQFYDNTFGV